MEKREKRRGELKINFDASFVLLAKKRERKNELFFSVRIYMEKKVPRKEKIEKPAASVWNFQRTLLGLLFLLLFFLLLLCTY